MVGRKRSTSFFDAQKLVRSLGDVLDSLPSEEDRQQIISNLEHLIIFLSDLKSRLEAIPTQADSTLARVALDRLKALFEDAKANPALGATVGIRPVERHQKASSITTDEIERARSTVARFDALPIGQIRDALEKMNARELQSVAAALGIRASQRAAREALSHQIATRITNTRGYRSLRDGES